DIAVVRGPLDRYRAGAPVAADLGILIEVADSSYAKDRGPKWERYASSRVLIYWIVNIPERRVEVYSSPAGRGRAAKYRDRKDYGPDDEVPVIVDGREIGRIKVSDIV